MHIPSRFTSLILVLLASSGPASAQLGPRPSEIPSPPVSVDEHALAAAVPSASERARPVVEEILFTQARTGTPGAAGTSAPGEGIAQAPLPGSLRQDLRANETLPAVTSDGLRGLVGGDGFDVAAPRVPKLGRGWGQTVIALSGVLLLIIGIAQFYKRLSRSQGGLVGQLGAGGLAPSGILEIIGRYPIGTGMTLVVMKFDRRILLVASGAATRGKHARGTSMSTLCELSDPEEVASVLLKSRSHDGETIARSFERALQEADDLTDESVYGYDDQLHIAGQVKLPQQRKSPVRTITTDEGDRAELWSSQTDGKAAARVLRQRLASMRRGEPQ